MDASHHPTRSSRPVTAREFNELGPTLASLALALVATAGCGKPADDTPVGQVKRNIATLSGEGWFTAPADQVAAAQALGDLTTEFGAVEVKAALGALFQATSGPLEVAAAAEAAFFRVGSAGVSYLSESLRDDSPAVRLKALKLIDRWGKEAAPAVPAVIELLNDEKRRPALGDLSLAQGVVEKLGTGALLEVRHLLDTRTRLDESGRWATALLKKWGAFEPVHLPAWRSAASDSSPAMRVHALEVLKLPGYGFESNRDIFINALKDEELKVALAAARAVVLEERAAPELVDLLSRYSRPQHERRSGGDSTVNSLIREIAPPVGLQAIPFLVSWMSDTGALGGRASLVVRSIEEDKKKIFAALVDDIERTRPVFTRWHYECLKALGGEALKELPQYSRKGYEPYAREQRMRIAELEMEAQKIFPKRSEIVELAAEFKSGSVSEDQYEAALKKLVGKEDPLQKKLRELRENK